MNINFPTRIEQQLEQAATKENRQIEDLVIEAMAFALALKETYESMTKTPFSFPQVCDYDDRIEAFSYPAPRTPRIIPGVNDDTAVLRLGDLDADTGAAGASGPRMK